MTYLSRFEVVSFHYFTYSVRDSCLNNNQALRRSLLLAAAFPCRLLSPQQLPEAESSYAASEELSVML